MGSKAFESPLISHARMRALYRALVETRALGAAAGRRVGEARFEKGLEACWVGVAVDLKDGDLTSESGGTALVEHVRRVGMREAAAAGEIRQALRGMADEKATFAGSAGERLLCAVGQAMALRAQGEKRVVVAYVRAGEVKAAEWRRVFAVAAGDLPLVIVCLPGAGKGVDLDRLAGVEVPVIPVDAGDVVALYRVAQESVGRARAEGGVVVIECVAMGVDPLKLMGGQLVKKGICTEAWVARVGSSVRTMVAKASLPDRRRGVTKG